MTSSPKFKVFDCVDIQKRKKIDKAKTVSKAMKEYWLKNRNDQIVELLIDIGGTAKDDLSRAKVVTGKKQILWKVQIVCCQSATESSRTSSSSVCLSEKFLFS